MDLGVLARIIARYGAGALVALGVLAPEEADLFMVNPNIIAALGAILGILAEIFYTKAKRSGGPT